MPAVVEVGQSVAGLSRPDGRARTHALRPYGLIWTGRWRGVHPAWMHALLASTILITEVPGRSDKPGIPTIHRR